MLDADQKRTQCTDVGTFRYQKGRETVNTAGFDELSDEFKTDCLTQCPNFFIATFKPAKKAIMEELKKIAVPFVYDGYFTLETAPDKFVFKPE